MNWSVTNVLKEYSFKQPKPTNKAPKGNYILQRKYDGERMFLIDKGVKGVLLNRRGVVKNKYFPELGKIARKLPGKNIVDGEVVVFDKNKIDRFKLLAERSRRKYKREEYAQKRPATFLAFDLLNKGNKNLTQFPWKNRNRLLKSLPQTKHFKKIASFPVARTREFLADKNTEGVVFKKVDAPYTFKKDDNWLKLKQKNVADIVITGYIKGEGKRKGAVGSINLGVYKDEKIVNVGKAGSFKNFKDSELFDLKKRLDKYKIYEDKDKVYTEPKVFASVEYMKIGSQGKLREPKVVGFRDDIRLKDTHTSFSTEGLRIIKLAKKLVGYLKPHAYRIAIAGSIRRKENPKDIDIVLVPKNKEKIKELISKIGKVIASGKHQIFARIERVDVDIFFSELGNFGAQLMTRTGPAGGNIGNRSIAKRKGMLLNQYGLFKDRRRIAGRTETGIYHALGKKYKSPHLRGK